MEILERLALMRARERVITPLLQASTIEQQRLTLLKVLSHSSVHDIASSIRVHNTKLGPQLLQCAKKLIKRGKSIGTKNHRISSTKRTVMKLLFVALLPTQPRSHFMTPINPQQKEISQ